MTVPKAGFETLDNEAITFFVHAAGYTTDSHKPQIPSLSSLGALVRQLDGIPLALQLAGRRMTTLSPEQLLLRLKDHTEILSATYRDHPARHQTLQHAINLSWQLLSRAEQEVLAQLSVFRNGFSLHAIEHVACLSDVEEHPKIVDIVQSLCDKSMVQTVSRHGIQEPRFDLLLSIRSFVTERLDDLLDRHALMQRYTSFFLEQGGNWAHAVQMTSSLVGLESLEREHENVLNIERLAFSYQPPTRDSATTILQTVLVLDPLSWLRGPFLGDLERLNRAIELTTKIEGISPSLLAQAFAARAAVLRTHGRMLECLEDFEQAFAVSPNDSVLRIRLINWLGVMAQDQKRFEEAHAFFGRALAIASAEKQQQAVSRTLCNIAGLHQEQGAYDDALIAYRRALKLASAVSDRLLEGTIEASIASVHHERGNPKSALEGYASGLEKIRPFKFFRLEAMVSGIYGAALAGAGDISRSRDTLEQAESLRGRSDDPFLTIALELCNCHLTLATASTYHEAIETIRVRIKAACTHPAYDDETMIAEEQSDDVRFVLRTLRSTLPELELWEQLSEPPVETPRLVVGPHCLWFREADHVVDLQRRGPLRRIFARFVQHHNQGKSTGLDVNTLLEAGWPGAQIVPEAGAARVYVGISTLRRLGLRDILISQDDGYRFASDILITFSQSTTPKAREKSDKPD
ncbi:MAG: tetratricopeptide repeat protein [Myxococcota bacterium]